jgi:hypothetical protein
LSMLPTTCSPVRGGYMYLPGQARSYVDPSVTKLTKYSYVVPRFLRTNTVYTSNTQHPERTDQVRLDVYVYPPSAALSLVETLRHYVRSSTTWHRLRPLVLDHAGDLHRLSERLPLSAGTPPHPESSIVILQPKRSTHTRLPASPISRKGVISV